MEVRFIENYCIDKEEHFATQVTPDWLADAAASIDLLIDRHFDDCRDAGPYTGPSGIAAALSQAVGAGLLPAERGASVVAKYRKLIPKRGGRPAYLCGALGDAVGSLDLEKDGQQQDMRHFVDPYVNDLLECPDEVLYGRAGALMAAKQAESITGQAGLSERGARRLIDKVLTHGRKAEGRGRGRPPLMWSWHDSEYLGAAHGVAGILQALLLHWQVLVEEERAAVAATSRWMLSIEESHGHWESSLSAVGSGRAKRLVHWCHGATGMVGFLLTAHRVLKFEAFLEAALRAGELIWREGVLKKGPGLCHGVGGGGLALLQLYGASGDERWLRRAKCFALMMMDKSVRAAQRTPDAPASLFEGWAGGLALLTGIVRAEKEQQDGLNVFPFMPIAV